MKVRIKCKPWDIRSNGEFVVATCEQEDLYRMLNVIHENEMKVDKFHERWEWADDWRFSEFLGNEPGYTSFKTAHEMYSFVCKHMEDHNMCAFLQTPWRVEIYKLDEVTGEELWNIMDGHPTMTVGGLTTAISPWDWIGMDNIPAIYTR